MARNFALDAAADALLALAFVCGALRSNSFLPLERVSGIWTDLYNRQAGNEFKHLPFVSGAGIGRGKLEWKCWSEWKIDLKIEWLKSLVLFRLHVTCFQITCGLWFNFHQFHGRHEFLRRQGRLPPLPQNT